MSDYDEYDEDFEDEDFNSTQGSKRSPSKKKKKMTRSRDVDSATSSIYDRERERQLSGTNDRVWSANHERFNRVQNKLTEATRGLKIARQEIKTLKAMQRRQEKALDVTVGDDAEMPRKLRRQTEDIRVLEERLRTTKNKLGDAVTDNKKKVKQVNKLQLKAKELQALVDAKGLKGRAALEETVSTLRAELEARDAKIERLSKLVELQSKERNRKPKGGSTAPTSSTAEVLSLRKEVSRLKAQLREQRKTAMHLPQPPSPTKKPATPRTTSRFSTRSVSKTPARTPAASPSPKAPSPAKDMVISVTSEAAQAEWKKASAEDQIREVAEDEAAAANEAGARAAAAAAVAAAKAADEAEAVAHAERAVAEAAAQKEAAEAAAAAEALAAATAADRAAAAAAAMKEAEEAEAAAAEAAKKAVEEAAAHAAAEAARKKKDALLAKLKAIDSKKPIPKAASPAKPPIADDFEDDVDDDVAEEEMADDSVSDASGPALPWLTDKKKTGAATPGGSNTSTPSRIARRTSENLHKGFSADGVQRTSSGRIISSDVPPPGSGRRAGGGGGGGRGRVAAPEPSGLITMSSDASFLPNINNNGNAAASSGSGRRRQGKEPKMAGANTPHHLQRKDGSNEKPMPWETQTLRTYEDGLGSDAGSDNGSVVSDVNSVGGPAPSSGRRGRGGDPGPAKSTSSGLGNGGGGGGGGGNGSSNDSATGGSETANFLPSIATTNAKPVLGKKARGPGRRGMGGPSKGMAGPGGGSLAGFGGPRKRGRGAKPKTVPWSSNASGVEDDGLEAIAI